jgi:hypothetical protein
MMEMAFLIRATKANQLDSIKNRVLILINYQSAVTNLIYGRK